MAPIHEIVRETLFATPSFALERCRFVVVSFPRSVEDEMQSKNVWLKGHTGLSTYSQ